MSDIELFKNIAIEKLPKSLYRQIEPFLCDILDSYDYAAWACANEMEAHYDRRDRGRRYLEIREEFGNGNEADWPSFARERWAEIDKHFYLEPPLKSWWFEDMDDD